MKIGDDNYCGTILLVGNWLWDIYEESMARGFSAAGWRVIPFKALDHLPCGRLATQLRRFRTHITGEKLNIELALACRNTQPDMVIYVRCDEIFPETIVQIANEIPGCFQVAYHNDNPYKGFSRRLKMRHFLGSLKHVSLTLVYRPGNVVAAQACGANRVEVLPPSYIRDRHFPQPNGEMNDVVYIGHFEDDGREDVVQAIHDSGIKLRIYGTGWEDAQQRKPWLAAQEIRQVWGTEYAALLSAAKISLVFLSTRNADVYTRRCFEIPACGSLMMAPRTPELEGLFADGLEAVYWDSPNDLVAKIRYYLEHDEERTVIAAAGHARLLRDGHDEYARAKQIISWHEQMSGKNNE